MNTLSRGILFLVCCLAVTGCGGNAVEVAGEVHFNGQPVAAGRIYFNPDAAKGQDGPQGFAEIRNGKFDTRQGGNAPNPGPTIVVIDGFAGSNDPLSMGEPLFAEYKESIDLPKGLTTRTFDVPANAGDTLKKQPKSGKI